MNNPYYHWLLPNYLVDYNNSTPRYDYLGYHASGYDTSSNYNSAQVAASPPAPATFQPNNHQLWNNYLYQQQSQQPQQPNTRAIQQSTPIDSYQISPNPNSIQVCNSPYAPISLQMHSTDQTTPLVTPTSKKQPRQVQLQLSSTKSTTDDSMSHSLNQRLPYYDPYMYAHQQQTQIQSQYYAPKNSNYLYII